MFIIPINVIASHTHTTPDKVDAIVFWSPCVLPPAAKKQAHVTKPAGTARLAIAPTLTHRAIRTPILTASAISMSIRSILLIIEDEKRKRLPCPLVEGGVRAVPPTARTSMCGIQPLPDDCTGQTRRFRCA